MILGFLLVLFLIGAFIAPVFMKAGKWNAAEIVYRFYSNFCHQFAHRSWFLYGEQAHYPADVKSGSSLETYSQAFGNDIEDDQLARSTIGNDKIGFKVAVCQRDVAIYFGLVLFCIVFQLGKRKLSKISLWLWLAIGVAPMGIDGTIQFISGMDFFAKLGLTHESDPFLRSLTGFLFGLFTGWYLLPAIEETFIDNKTREALINAD